MSGNRFVVEFRNGSFFRGPRSGRGGTLGEAMRFNQEKHAHQYLNRKARWAWFNGATVMPIPGGALMTRGEIIAESTFPAPSWDLVHDVEFERVRRLAVPGGWLYQTEIDQLHEVLRVGEDSTRVIGWHPPVFVPDGGVR